MECDFGEQRRADGRYRCSRCGRKIASEYPPRQVRARCKLPGLGDRVAKLLTALGIDGRPGCGCKARQKWLNEQGLQISKALKRLFRSD